ncbi:MAG: PEP-CTERM sorting domain-containing protein, partial [Planctomycetia bacterium]|nr:PEP-CTERM sorting domain-containing protein [Planctomycetia bacterium]
KNGHGAYSIVSNSRNRWGDFSAISLDPNDPYSFWISGEVAIDGTGTSFSNVWGTQIAQVEFVTPEPSAILLAAIGLIGLALKRRRA